MLKAFLICPVRGHDKRETLHWVWALEDMGYAVHWPPRDTWQDDPVGLDICQANYEAIEAADKVFVVWDGKSAGSLFDLGMAFALNKPLEVLEAPAPTLRKSFQNMMRAWEDTQLVEQEE